MDVKYAIAAKMDGDARTWGYASRGLLGVGEFRAHFTCEKSDAMAYADPEDARLAAEGLAARFSGWNLVVTRLEA